MTEPTLNYVSCPDAAGGHRMAYWEWGDPANPHVVMCVHGLSRQGRDFDVLARYLCDEVRVICPDVVGRGQSDWLKDPSGYQIPFYAADMLALLAQVHQQSPITTLDWVGTSMGGLIGLAIAGQSGAEGGALSALMPARVNKLVLNDVGPAIEWLAIERISAYLGKAGHFESTQAAADAMWAISTSFGPHTPEQWLELSRHMVKPVPGASDGSVMLHFDPALAVPLRATTQESAKQGEAMLWQLYDQVRATTLILRGAESDLLSHATAQAMTQRGPKARLVEFEGVGHAPTLVAMDQVTTVGDFLFV
ncbi:MAG TPA: alpha/beta hydrolase [Polaromonas sp.]|uniref:alpha/beta fold hydrolase n=1 Tax=Polaromonas sp. TaxID=1869339 RepID=UPI002D63C2A0|nr:alpha/beta hydrolase [Polaromonas sp.]HYW55935.1 alpha/beta hydrolase [Polaromonas sp.]